MIRWMLGGTKEVMQTHFIYQRMISIVSMRMHEDGHNGVLTNFIPTTRISVDCSL